MRKLLAMRRTLLALGFAACNCPWPYAARWWKISVEWKVGKDRFEWLPGLGRRQQGDKRPGVLMFPNWYGVVTDAAVEKREDSSPPDDYVILLADVYGQASKRPEERRGRQCKASGVRLRGADRTRRCAPACHGAVAGNLEVLQAGQAPAGCTSQHRRDRLLLRRHPSRSSWRAAAADLDGVVSLPGGIAQPVHETAGAVRQRK